MYILGVKISCVKGSQGLMLVLGMAVREEVLCKLDGDVDVEML